MTTTHTNLPEDVKQAIHQNRKIEAIKLLREQSGLGLKEAKQQVDEYVREHELPLASPLGTSTGSRHLLLIVAVIVLAYGIYRIIS